MIEQQPKIGDLLYGAAAISRFLFGNDRDRRRVYGLAGSGAIPTFKLGSVLCGRGGRIAAAIEEKERAARGGMFDEDPPSQSRASAS